MTAYEGDYYMYGGAEMRVGYADIATHDGLRQTVDILEEKGGTLVVGDTREDVTDLLLTSPHDGATAHIQNRQGTIVDARLPYLSLRDMQYIALVYEDKLRAPKTVRELGCVLLAAAQDTSSLQPDAAVFMKNAELRINQRTIQNFAEYAARSQPTRRAMRVSAQRLLVELASFNDAPFDVPESETSQYVEYRKGEPYVSISSLRRVVLERGYVNDAPNASLGLLSPICQRVLVGYEPEPTPTTVRELVANRDVFVNRRYILEQGSGALSAGVEAVRAQVFVDTLRQLPPIAYSEVVGDGKNRQHLAEVSYTTKYIAARVASGLVRAGLAE